MSEETDVLKLVCQKLNQADIPYMLTGSFAANFYAMPRMTRDIDIVVEVDPSCSATFSKVFEDEFYVDSDSIQEAVGEEGMFNIIHQGTIWKVDFIIRKKSLYRLTEFKRRRLVELEGVTIWIVSPEDLILSKLYWSKDSFSEMQLKDIQNLFSSIKNLDVGYIEQWIPHLQLEPVYKALNERHSP